jgi:hypothetical protein
LAFRYPPADTPVHDQFEAYTRSAGTVLVYGAVVALLLGFALASLQVWNQYEQFREFNPNTATWRVYGIQFLQSLSGYGITAAVLFAGGMLVNSLSWFYSALSADFDDLYEHDADSPGAGNEPPPSNPSDWTRPIGSS